MKVTFSLSLFAFSLMFLSGCGGTPTSTGAKPGPSASPKDVDPKIKVDQEKEKERLAQIKANLGKLSPEDRKLAEAQGFCAVEPENPLGEMGTPIKLMLDDKPVFLCCGSCKKKAEKDREKTLASVEDLKKKVAASAGK